MSLKRMTVRSKLIGVTAFFLADLLLMGAFSYHQEIKLIGLADTLALTTVPSVANMSAVDMMHDGLRANVLSGLLVAANVGTLEAEDVRAEGDEFRKNMQASLDALDQLDIPLDIKELLAASRPTVTAYMELSATINGLSLNKDLNGALSKMPEFQDQFKKLETDLGALGEAIEKEAAASQKEHESGSKAAVVTLLGLVAAGLLLGSSVAWLTIRSTMRSVGDSSSAILDQSETVGRIAKAVDESASELARTVEAQARSVQRSAATVHEISEMARLSADNAVAVRESASSAVGVASNGKSRVSDMVRVFAEISQTGETIRGTVTKSNQQMASISKVIQEIATKTQVINEIVFQTKLLSFNASVEAARAGEHGKGFAVVAEEVGNLARSSGAAAEQIASMLASSIRNVEEAVETARRDVEAVMRESAEKIKLGEQTARECDRILDQVVDVSQGVLTKVDQISNAIKEQSVGVTDMSKTLQDLESSISGTQQQSVESANHSSDMAKAAASMQITTSELRASLGLKLETQGAAPAPGAAPVTTAVSDAATDQNLNTAA